MQGSHFASIVQHKLQTLQWEILLPPPESLNFSPPDSCWFCSMQPSLVEQHFRSYLDIETWGNY